MFVLCFFTRFIFCSANFILSCLGYISAWILYFFTLTTLAILNILYLQLSSFSVFPCTHLLWVADRLSFSKVFLSVSFQFIFRISFFCCLVYLILHIMFTILVFTTIFLLSVNSRVYFVYFFIYLSLISYLFWILYLPRL